MTTAGKHLVFRVTGLPIYQSDKELETRLRSVIDDNLLPKEKKPANSPKVALIPSCLNDKETSVALVEFVGDVPHFLSSLTRDPLREWQVEMDDTDINFDCHFWGFTQLYKTEPGNAVTAE